MSKRHHTGSVTHRQGRLIQGYTGKEDFIQGIAIGEGLSYPLLKEKVENFWVLGSTSGKLLGLCGGGWLIAIICVCYDVIWRLDSTLPRNCLLGALSFLMVILKGWF